MRASDREERGSRGRRGRLGSEEIRRIERLLRRACGGEVPAALRGPLRRHLAAGARELGLRPEELLPRILAGARPSRVALLEAAAAGETWFYRHPEQLVALGRLLRACAPGRPLRLWSAGCGSGEEPYGLAMALLEAGRAKVRDRILATDVSERALDHAREGVYGRWSFRQDLGELRGRHFTGPGLAEVSPELRARVELRLHDLARDAAPPGPFDAVLCRNVLSHLEPRLAARALGELSGAVRPGGLLVLAPAELPLARRLAFERVDGPAAGLLRRPEAGESRPPARAAHGQARRAGAA